MAKKAKKNKPAPPKRAAKTKAGKATAKAKKAKHRVPAARALPGMGQVRNAALDRFCVRIANTRDALNELAGEKAAIEDATLQQMRRDNLFTYTHHGVTLVRQEGHDKLKVTKARDGEATASSHVEESAGDEGAVVTQAFAGADDDDAGDELGEEAPGV